MAHVAFIGLGRMGHGMAGRYLDSGFSVAVWNRSKSKAEDLIARGARCASSPGDAAEGAAAIVTMVADDAAARAVWLGKAGAGATAKAGTLAIECSTVSYRHALDIARELRGRGLVYIDSPVTGLPDAAANGKLTLLVGAEPADLEKARPFLAPLSATIRHFGAAGTVTVYKLINNQMGAIQIAGIAGMRAPLARNDGFVDLIGRLTRCLPFRKPARKASAVARPAVPCSEHLAVARDQQYHIETSGAAQRIDRLAWGLRHRTCDIE